MQYDLEISEHNKQAHIDIENDIQKQKNGLFTFILRINSGNIVDYSVVEVADARKYLSITKIVVKELIVPLNPVIGNQQSPIRTNDSEHTT